MANKKTTSACLPSALSTVAFFLFFGLLLTLYILTGFLPFLLSGTVILIPALMLMGLFLFRQPFVLKHKEDKEFSEKRFVRFFQKIGRAFRRFAETFKKIYNNYRTVIKVFFLILLFVVIQVFFLYSFKLTREITLALWQPVALIGLMLVSIVLDIWCKHTDTENDFDAAILKSIRAYFRPVYAVILLCIAGSVLKALSLWDVTVYLKYIIAGVFYYTSVFAAISLVISGIRGELDKRPLTVMPLPFIKGDADGLSLIDYLESNTGITMRGLWSVKYIKQIAPVTVLIIAGFLWISTCIVQIDPYSQGAVYRLGTLREDTLGPGLHLVLPYPIDKVNIYNTESVNKITVGYSSTEDTDNIWTGGHGSNEYKLLLGGGDELVSINLRIEYKISNLRKYLSNTSSPTQFLEALAYELVTDRTIDTDLASLLSADRDAFAKSFNIELSRKLEKHDIGIEIVSVVLESIHPPLEIAGIYQKIISAEITAEKAVIDAKAIAATITAEAESKRDTVISEAKAEQSTKIAAAKTAIAEFTAGVDAYNNYPKAYTYNKYLKAITQAYGKANLVIVGEGVDSSKIYFGNFDVKTAE